MPTPYDPILTHAGLLSNGELTKTARDKYVDEVAALLLTGNADGKGAPTSAIALFTALVPLPPIPGPKIMNVTTLQEENLFWFGPDPIAAVIATQLKDQSRNPIWHSIFPDFLYKKTAQLLDLTGKTPLFPIFDPTAAFLLELEGKSIQFPLTLPELAAELKLTLPELSLKLADLSIKLVSLPTIDIPSILPEISGVDLTLEFLTLPDLLLRLFKLPFELLLQIITPDVGLVLDLPKLPSVVLNIAIDILLKILTDLGLLLTLPRTFIASILVWLKDIVAMVCTVIVGLLVGSGSMSKSMAVLTGLI